MSRNSSRQINDYVVWFHSLDKIDGKDWNYTVNWPKNIEAGKYKGTVSILCDAPSAVKVGLYLESASIINTLTTRQQERGALAVVFDQYAREGTMYFQDPQGSMSVGFIDMSDGEYTIDVGDNEFCIHLTKIGSPDKVGL